MCNIWFWVGTRKEEKMLLVFFFFWGITSWKLFSFKNAREAISEKMQTSHICEGTYLWLWNNILTLWKSYILIFRGDKQVAQEMCNGALGIRKHSICCYKVHRIDLSSPILCKLNAFSVPSLLYLILISNFLGLRGPNNSSRDKNEKKMGLFNLKRYYFTKETKEEDFFSSFSTHWL